MAANNDLRESYEQLMTVSQRLLHSGYYEAAFHSLQAALHCAEDLKDENYLISVQQGAERQRDLINDRSPEHRMSTRSAQKRGGTNLYDILIRQAAVHINQLKHERRHKMVKPPNVWDS